MVQRLRSKNSEGRFYVVASAKQEIEIGSRRTLQNQGTQAMLILPCIQIFIEVLISWKPCIFGAWSHLFSCRGWEFGSVLPSKSPFQLGFWALEMRKSPPSSSRSSFNGRMMEWNCCHGFILREIPRYEVRSIQGSRIRIPTR